MWRCWREVNGLRAESEEMALEASEMVVRAVVGRGVGVPERSFEARDRVRSAVKGARILVISSQGRSVAWKDSSCTLEKAS